MFDTDTLEACLAELPPLGGRPVRSLKKVTEPRRPRQMPDATIYMDGDQRFEPVGYVFTLPKSKVFVDVTEGGILLCGAACYLDAPAPELTGTPGRSNFQPFSKIRGSEGASLSLDEQKTLREMANWSEQNTSFDQARCG